MFARWAECSPTSESSPLDNKKCPPRSPNYDESFAFWSASRVGRPGQAESERLWWLRVHIRERRVRGRGGSPRPDHPIRSNRQAWFCSQSNFVTFVYPSDGSPFGGSLGTDSLCVDWLNAESLPLAGDRVFHRISRYSCQHSHFWYLQVLSPKTFPDWQNVPLLTLEKAAFKVSSLRWITWALIHFRCHGARPVSYYAFFKGWLLPSPPPGCHRSITSFSTKWLLRDLSVRSGLFPSRLWILAPQKSVCTNDLGLYSEFPWGW